MKTCVASVIFLLLGLAVGFYAGNRTYHKNVADEATRALVESLESHDALTASVNAHTISLIDSGKDKEAVQLLSFSIAHYYSIYASSEFTNVQRLKLRATIDGLASSNQIVAAQIAENMSRKKKW